VTTPAEILRATPEAWERVRAIRLAALRDAPDAFWADLEDEVPLSPQEWREQLSDPEFAVFLAVVAGEDVGLAGIGRSHAHPEDASLSMLWIAPQARGTGLADRLVEAALNSARERGYPRVRLWVNDVNNSAAQLYERHGFTPTGVTGTFRPPRSHIREHELALEL
jgi:ribosomal protein S18 acetylase RimI-like enzyme